GGECAVHGDAKRADALLVGRRHLDEGGVELKGAALLEQRGDLGEERGRVVRAAFLHRLADIGADEEGVVAEAPLHAGRDVWGRGFGVEVDDLDVAQLAGPGDEGVYEARWGRCPAVEVDPLAGLDVGDSLFRGDSVHASTSR